jgi:FtsZ-binding cell division protein ZapB
METSNIKQAIETLQSLKLEMHELTTKQSDKLKQIHIMAEKLQDVQAKIMRDEQTVKFDVAQEVGADGKKKFTNEAMRDHETMRRLETSTAYTAYKQEQNEYTKSLSKMQLRESQLSKRKSGLMYEIQAQITVVTALIEIAKLPQLKE